MRGISNATTRKLIGVTRAFWADPGIFDPEIVSSMPPRKNHRSNRKSVGWEPSVGQHAFWGLAIRPCQNATLVSGGRNWLFTCLVGRFCGRSYIKMRVHKQMLCTFESLDKTDAKLGFPKFYAGMIRCN